MHRLVLASLLVFALSSCKSSEDDVEEPPAETPVTKKKQAKGLLDRGMSLGKSAISKTTETSESALRLASATLDDGRALGESSLAELRGASESLIAAAGGELTTVRKGVNHLVTTIANAPDVANREKIERIFILMVPVIGPSKRFLDARTTYRAGRNEDDDAKLALARRETLMACAEMGLDVGTLGLLGGGADLVATGADKVLGALKLGRTINVLTGSDNDVLTAYLDSMLENEHLRATVDASLSAGA